MVLKLYYKLENKEKSAGSTVYSIRNPQNQMPKIKHEYAKNSFRCELIKITNIINNSDLLRIYLTSSTLTLYMDILIILKINL